ncbi:MAG: FkbM family methyltransferase [Candidatus Paceibacterota bacterium]|jgi:hypothetical protein
MHQELKYFKKNIVSQWGEDGIVEEIFNRIGGGNKFCIEFGSWDGKHLSNTWNLWHEKGWGALLIEGDPKKFVDLKKTTELFQNVIPVCAFVEAYGKNSLDKILERMFLQKQIDLLSIDIDGNDFYILETLQIRPRVIIIEYNPTIPPTLNIVQKTDEYFGASAKALVELAQKKGYELVALTDTNCIFIEGNLFQNLGINKCKLSDLFIDGHLTYVMSSFDGVTFVNRMPSYGTIGKSRYFFYKILGKLPQPKSEYPMFPIIFKKPDILIERIARRLTRNIRRLLKKTPVRFVFYKLQSHITKHKNKLIHKKKEEVIFTYQKKYGYSTLIETGTYRGEMIQAMLKTFEHIYSIELNKKLFQEAKKRFETNTHVKIINGDSGKILSQILESTKKPCLFWLDAHYSSGETSKGDLDTPIAKELEIILNHSNKKHSILIDDARLFNGTNDYPEIEALKKIIFSKNKKLEIEVSDDIIKITPKIN